MKIKKTKPFTLIGYCKNCRRGVPLQFTDPVEYGYAGCYITQCDECAKQFPSQIKAIISVQIARAPL